MAYLKELWTKCANNSCLKRAAWEVFNNKNASQGQFCKGCANARLLRLNRGEAADAAVVRTSSE